MKIECTNCKKVYHIPEERLPKDKSFAFPCRACKAIIEIDPRSIKIETAGIGKTEQGHLAGDELKKKILRTVKNLPPMPQTVFKAREIMADPNSSFETLARVLETDPAIATKILQLANSAYYGFFEIGRGRYSKYDRRSGVIGSEGSGRGTEKRLIRKGFCKVFNQSSLFLDSLPSFSYVQFFLR